MESIEDLVDGLSTQGYLADQGLATALYLSLRGAQRRRGPL